MKKEKVQTKRRQLFFGLFATAAFALGIGVNLVAKSPIQTKAADTATYTVASTSSVTTSGTTPAGSSATYTQTYTATAGQMTGGNSATLTLSGYGGNKITKVTLSMKSNSKTGSGTLEIKSGNTIVSSIDPASAFNTASWYGSWSQSYVDVIKIPTEYAIQNGENIVITIAATANSLYIQKYTLEYELSGPSVQIEGGNRNLDIGGIVSLTATPASIDGEYSLAWNSSNALVASVSEAGLVTAIKPGTTNITAVMTYDGETYESAPITVTVATPTVSIVGGNKTIAIGESVTLAKTVGNAVEGNATFEWISNTPSIAEVDALTGEVTGISAGSANITVKMTYEGEVYASSAIQVTVYTPVASVTLPTKTATIYSGGTNNKTVQLTKTVLPAEADQTVTWTTSNATVATVSNTGLVTAVGAGSATITATSTVTPEKSDTATITVIGKAISGISTSGTLTKTEYYKGEKLNLAGLTVNASYNNGDTTTVVAHSNFASSLLPLTAGTTSVVLNYQGHETTVSGITVLDRALVSLEMGGSLAKDHYFVGETFSAAGLTFTAVYSDGHRELVTNQVTLSTTAIVSGLDEIEVSYTLTRDYPTPVIVKTSITEFTVTPVILETISVKTPATKTTFALGEEFSHAGLVINAHYNKETVEKAAGFTVSGVDTMKLGAQTATVTFEGKTATYYVKVTNEGANVGHTTLASDLIFSEYIEGSSNNKALEIYNGTGNSINLEDYSVNLYSNGASSASKTLNLSTLQETIGHNETIILVHGSASSSFKVGNYYSISNGVTDFNGDDAVALLKSGDVIDLIGIIGEDPGSYWEGKDKDGNTSRTADMTLVRAASVINPSDTFTWNQWVTYPKDTATYLGSHVMNAQSKDATPLEQATAFADYVVNGIGNNAASYEGGCLAVLEVLELEYGFMTAEAKALFDNPANTEFNQAQNYMAYLRAWAAANTPVDGGDRPTLPNTTSNHVTTIFFIGGIGITMLLGYYFIKKEQQN